MEKTSLERSHSKWSNFKLTMMVLLASISIFAVFAGLAILKAFQTPAIICMASGGALFLISFIMLMRFKR